MSLPPNRDLLKEYPNKYFVETGTFRGDAVQLAREAGFKHIKSIDTSEENINQCAYRFALVNQDDEDLKFWVGDSSEWLFEMIKDINEPITFWLDAHHQLTEDEPLGDNPFPLAGEIEQIARHPIKSHTIIIDDLLYMTNEMLTGLSYANLVYMIKEINWKYKFELIANPTIKNILVAHI